DSDHGVALLQGRSLEALQDGLGEAGEQWAAPGEETNGRFRVKVLEPVDEPPAAAPAVFLEQALDLRRTVAGQHHLGLEGGGPPGERQAIGALLPQAAGDVVLGDRRPAAERLDGEAWRVVLSAVDGPARRGDG